VVDTNKLDDNSHRFSRGATEKKQARSARRRMFLVLAKQTGWLMIHGYVVMADRRSSSQRSNTREEMALGINLNIIS
jgi:hypothetical protein